MKDLNLDICKQILGNNYLGHYIGCDTFFKIFVCCSCITSDAIRKLCEFDNFYIHSFNNLPTIVIRCKRNE